MSELRAQLQTTLGDAYTLERELGGGGMSRVFVARDNALGREVVVKVLAPELSASVSAERFTREIATAARLQQANIVPVLSAGTSGGVSYYTMPFVKGESLRAQLASGVALPLTDRLHVLRDVARALAYAHGEGVIHRDIKPDNILLSAGTAVVTDFGIAKAISASRTLDGAAPASPDGTLTQVGSSIGTPAYMAPEQAVGESVDARADLYAWGVVAYEVLSGAHPFAGKTGTSQLIAAHIAETPKNLNDIAPPVPNAVSTIVMQCLAKAAADRPASAGAILAALDSANTSAPAAVPRPASVTTASSPAAAAKPRFSTAVRATALVTLAIALVVALRYMVRPTIDPTKRTVVVMPFENLGNPSDAYFADGVSEEIANQLAQLPGVRVIGRDGVRGATVAGMRPRELAASLDAQYVLTGTVQWARAAGDSIDGNARVQVVPLLTEVSAGDRVWSQPFEERLRDVFKVQASVAVRVADALAVTLSPAQRAAVERDDKVPPAARDAQLRARALLRQRGLANLNQAQSLFAQAVALDSTYARAWAGRAESVYLRSAYSDTVHTSMENLAEAMSAVQRAMALDSSAVDVRLAFARVLFGQFRMADALRALDGVIASDSTSAFVWILKGETLEGLGRQTEAGEAFRQAVQLDRLAPVVHAARAGFFVNAGMSDSAITSAERAVALAPNEARWKANLTSAYLASGRMSDAIRVCTQLLTADDCSTLIGGLSGEAAGRPAALALVRRLPAGVLTLSDRAVFLARLGDREGAMQALQKSVAERESNVIHNIPNPGIASLHDDPRWAAIVRAVRGEPTPVTK